MAQHRGAARHSGHALIAHRPCAAAPKRDRRRDLGGRAAGSAARRIGLPHDVGRSRANRIRRGHRSRLVVTGDGARANAGRHDLERRPAARPDDHDLVWGRDNAVESGILRHDGQRFHLRGNRAIHADGAKPVLVEAGEHGYRDNDRAAALAYRPPDRPPLAPPSSSPSRRWRGRSPSTRRAAPRSGPLPRRCWGCRDTSDRERCDRRARPARGRATGPPP